MGYCLGDNKCQQSLVDFLDFDMARRARPISISLLFRLLFFTRAHNRRITGRPFQGRDKATFKKETGVTVDEKIWETDITLCVICVVECQGIIRTSETCLTVSLSSSCVIR